MRAASKKTSEWVIGGLVSLLILGGIFYWASKRPSPPDVSEPTEKDILERLTAPPGEPNIDPEVLKRLTAPEGEPTYDPETLQQLTAPQ